MEKIKQASALLAACTLCPRQCKVDRTKGERGVCATGEKGVVANFSAHFGEEPQLVGERGSGTIFFSHCNLKCVFCQNYDISVVGEGIACGGLIVRHLVMPGDLDGTYHILKFLNEKVSAHTHVNIMSQYHPMGEATTIKELSRCLTPDEFRRALDMAKLFDLEIIR